MNKKKLTLLIALSTATNIIFSCCLIPTITVASKSNIITVETVEVLEKEETPQIVETIVETIEVEVEIEEITPTDEYPIITQIWGIMKDYGWSDIICAGILGNIMRECGGDTFNLNPYATNNIHYGLCQWSIKYHQNAWGLDVAGQLEYLKNTLDLSIFNKCTTPEQVAEVFCWKYERPGKKDPIWKRTDNARTVYNYFIK